MFAEACEDRAWNEDSYKYLGTVDDRPVQMLVDIGSDQTIVSPGVVMSSKLDACNNVPVLCAHREHVPILLLKWSWSMDGRRQPD